MTQIPSSLANSGRDSIIALLKSNVAGSSGDDAYETPSAPSAPSATVDLSKEAKAILSLESDQKVADKLRAILKGDQSSSAKTNVTLAESLLGATEAAPDMSHYSGRVQILKEAAAEGFKGHDFDRLIEQHRIATRGGVGLIDGLPSPEDDFVQSVLFGIAADAELLERHGKTEEFQKLYDAVTNGTLQIEDPNKIENLTVSYEPTVTRNGYGISREFNLDVSASGAVKDDLGTYINLASIRGFGEDGAFYFDWSGTDKTA